VDIYRTGKYILFINLGLWELLLLQTIALAPYVFAVFISVLCLVKKVLLLFLALRASGVDSKFNVYF